MQPSDLKRFKTAFVGISNSIGQGGPFSEGDLELIFAALMDLDFAVLQQALVDHMNSGNGKWRPNAHYIREAIKARTCTQWLGANEAWGRISRPGQVGTVKRANDWGDIVTCRDYREIEPPPCIVNQQMLAAMALAQIEIDKGNDITARVVFVSTYERLVEIEKAAGRAPRYWVSPGGTHEEQAAVREDGIRLGLLNATWAPLAVPQLGTPSAADRAKLKEALAGLKMKSLPPPEAE